MLKDSEFLFPLNFLLQQNLHFILIFAVYVNIFNYRDEYAL